MITVDTVCKHERKYGNLPSYITYSFILVERDLTEQCIIRYALFLLMQLPLSIDNLTLALSSFMENCLKQRLLSYCHVLIFGTIQQDTSNDVFTIFLFNCQMLYWLIYHIVCPVVFSIRQSNHHHGRRSDRSYQSHCECAPNKHHLLLRGAAQVRQRDYYSSTEGETQFIITYIIQYTLQKCTNCLPLHSLLGVFLDLTYLCHIR